MYLNYAPMAGLSVLFRLFGWLLGRSDGCFARARACPDGMQPGGVAVLVLPCLYVALNICYVSLFFSMTKIK